MQEGMWLTKIRGSKILIRCIKYDPEQRALTWISRTKKPRFIPINTIRKVLRGKNTKAFQQKKLEEVDGQLCFTICHGPPGKLDELSLIADTHAASGLWVTGVRHLMAKAQSKESTYLKFHTAWLRSVFDEFDENKDGVITEGEFYQIVSHLIPEHDPVAVSCKFKNFMDMHNEGLLPSAVHSQISYDQFLELYSLLFVRQEVYFLMDSYSSLGTNYLTAAELQRFYRIEQQMLALTVADCEAQIDKYEPSPEGKSMKHLGVWGFTRLLTTELPAVTLQSFEIDYTLPLHNYYIAASHNTFLLKDQIKGPSDPEAYTQALQRGARFVEIDTWDGDGGEPVVYNGYTSTSKVPLRGCLEAISKNAFTHSPLPLIVFLENHCGPEQQSRVVSQFLEIFGTSLYSTTERDGYLPTPRQLARHVVLMSKRLKPEVTDDVGEVSEDDEAEPHDARRKRRNKGRASDALTTDAPRPSYKLTRALSDLTVLGSQKLDEACLIPGDKWLVSSLDDNKATKICEQNESAFAALCHDRLVRVYASALHVNSENFEGQDARIHGAQIISMNTQTHDIALRCHFGLFLGRCGYSLKPRMLRRPFRVFNPKTPKIAEKAAKKFVIEVISAQHLPQPESSRKNIVDPFVCVAVDGLPCDTDKFTTKAVENNVLNPYFSETITFSVVCPDLAVISFMALDDSRIGDNFIGQFTCPLSLLASGYRHLPLCGKDGAQLPGASIFVKITLSDSGSCEPKEEFSYPPQPSAPSGNSSVNPFSDLKAAAKRLRDLDEQYTTHATAFQQLAQRATFASGADRFFTELNIGSKGEQLTLTTDSKSLKISVRDSAHTDLTRKLLEPLSKVLRTADFLLTACVDVENSLDNLAVSVGAIETEADKTLCIAMYDHLFSLIDSLTSQAEDHILSVKNKCSETWKRALESA